MKCDHAHLLFEPAVEECLQPEVMADLMKHLEKCASCAAEFENAQAFVQILERIPAPPPPPDLPERVKAKVRLEARRIRRAKILGWTSGIGLPILFLIIVQLFFPGGMTGFFAEAQMLAASWWKLVTDLAIGENGKPALAALRQAFSSGVLTGLLATVVSGTAVACVAGFLVYRAWKARSIKKSGF